MTFFNFILILYAILFCFLGIVILRKTSKTDKDIIADFISNSDKERVHSNRVISNEEYSDVLNNGISLINNDTHSLKISPNVPDNIINISLPDYSEIK